MPAVLLDSSVLVHAAYKGAPLHHKAALLVGHGLRRARRFCIAPQNLVEFAAVVTRQRFAAPPMEPADVLRITDLLYRSRRLAKIYPQRGTVHRTMKEGAALRIRGPRWYDLLLAVTMRDAGIDTLVTENTADFSAVPFVRPLTIETAYDLFIDA